MIFNNSSAVLYVKLGEGAASDGFSFAMSAKNSNGIGALFEIPYTYSGIITGVWASANGQAFVTEFL